MGKKEAIINNLFLTLQTRHHHIPVCGVVLSNEL